MANLLTVADLKIWPGVEADLEADDPWALFCISAASTKVNDVAGHPEWTKLSAPPRARQIALHLTARSFLNPDSVIQEGNTGPLGGDRIADDFAHAFELTPSEEAELAGLVPGAALAGKGLWIQPLTPGVEMELPDVFLLDDSGSDWAIPYASWEDSWAFTPLDD